MLNLFQHLLHIILLPEDPETSSGWRFVISSEVRRSREIYFSIYFT